MAALPSPVLECPEVPGMLRDLSAWLVWKFEPGENGKARKVPYYARTITRRQGEQGSAADRAGWADFDTAVSASLRYGFDGIGLALAPEFGIVALDFDNCVHNGKVDPAVESLVSATYAEYSPSGTGVRAFMRGSLPDKKSRASGGAFGFETFHEKGFVTITGNALPACRMFDTLDTIAEVSPAVAALYQERFGNSGRKEQAPGDDFVREMTLRNVDAATMAELRDALLHGLAANRTEEYGDWINVGHALKSLSRSEFATQALELWHEFSRRSPRYDADETAAKWGSFSASKITYRSIFKWAQDDGWRNPKSAEARKLGDADQYTQLEDRTDTGNANLLARLTDGDLRYVPERRLWLWWDGKRWIADEFGAAAHAAAQRVARFYHAKASELKEQAAAHGLSEDERKRIGKAADGVDKWAAHCRNRRTIDSLLALASFDPRLAVAAADLDSDPWLFGVTNGVVDLRTGQLRDAARDEFVTKRSPVAFDHKATAPRWVRFIDEITGLPLPVEYDAEGHIKPESVGRYERRPELAAYLQRALGYCLTGSTAEQKLFLAIGPGSNGKNVLLDVVQEIAGDYCRTIAPEFLMATRHEADAERPSSTAASLAGARLAISSESKDGQRLDVGLVKRHTGGGFLTARLMRENTFRFAITHKLVLMTNHTPSLDHLDSALRGRLHLIPFDRVWNRPGHSERDTALPDGDKDLMQHLRAEAQGVLAWLVQGSVDYARFGLEPPREVVRMTQAYFAEQDPVSRWLERYERCDPKQGASAAELFKDYVQWHRDEDAGLGQSPESEKAFAQALASRGVQKAKTKTANKYGLRPQKVEGGG